MIREALQWLAELKAAAIEPTKLLDRADRVILWTHDGQIYDHELPAPPRNHTVHTIDAFARACLRWKRGDKSVIFHDENMAVFVAEDDDRRARVLLPLPFSELFARVLELRQGQPLEQREFLRLLRHDLIGACPVGLATAIQKIEVVTTAGQRSEINPGRERGTREFAADLQASGEIPEVVTLSVPVYSMPGLDSLTPIRCSLEYTLPPRTVQFVLRPLPDETMRAVDSAQACLHTLLESLVSEDGESIDVFFGEP